MEKSIQVPLDLASTSLFMGFTQAPGHSIVDGSLIQDAINLKTFWPNLLTYVLNVVLDRHIELDPFLICLVLFPQAAKYFIPIM